MNNNFIMTNGTMNGMDTFADTIKAAMELCYGDDVKVVVHDVKKNNDVIYKGLTIVKSDCNITPTIYLEAYYAEYMKGNSMENICKEIMDVYEMHSVEHDFDITLVTDFNKAKDNICFKVINVEKNEDLLKTIPHKMFLDLAIVFYVDLSNTEVENGTVLVQNHFLNIWKDVDTDMLYELALANTQRMHHGRVSSMLSVFSEIFDEVDSEEFFDLPLVEDVPMYIATNVQKVLGAAIILYDGILKAFAERIGGDFYILPSSTHEVLFVPVTCGMDVAYLRQMVYEVNATEITEEEFLSNNVYYYNMDTDRMVIAQP